jgi:hypothetical protein
MVHAAYICRDRREADRILSGETTMIARKTFAPDMPLAAASAGDRLRFAFLSGRIFAEAEIDVAYDRARFDRKTFAILLKSCKARLNLSPQAYARLGGGRVCLVGFKNARPAGRDAPRAANAAANKKIWKKAK